MPYKLVAFDCDGVLVDTASSWQYIHEHFGVNNEVSVQAYLRGDIDGPEFMRRDISLWTAKHPGITLDDIRAILDRIPPMKGLDELFRALHDCGCKAVIISGGLDILVDGLAERIGAHGSYSNGLEADRRGRLTGEGILRVEPKDKRGPLREAMKGLGLSKKDVAAVGDTAGDATMFSVSGLGVAFNPQDEVVRKKADRVVEEKDLRKLLDILL
jgi:phosphoserine phosphatase